MLTFNHFSRLPTPIEQLQEKSMMASSTITPDLQRDMHESIDFMCEHFFPLNIYEHRAKKLLAWLLHNDHCFFTKQILLMNFLDVIREHQNDEFSMNCSFHELVVQLHTRVDAAVTADPHMDISRRYIPSAYMTILSWSIADHVTDTAYELSPEDACGSDVSTVPGIFSCDSDSESTA